MERAPPNNDSLHPADQLAAETRARKFSLTFKQAIDRWGLWPVYNLINGYCRLHRRDLDDYWRDLLKFSIKYLKAYALLGNEKEAVKRELANLELFKPVD